MKQILLKSIIYLCLLLGATSCKKTTQDQNSGQQNTSGNTLINLWKLENPAGMLKYLDFKNDTTCVAFLKDDLGFDTYITLPYTYNAANVYIKIPGFTDSQYAYVADKVSLVLSANGKDPVKLGKTADAVYENWAKDIDALEQWSNIIGNNKEGLGYDNGFLLTCGYPNDMVTAINMNTKKTESAWNPGKGSNPARIESDGEYWYTSSKNSYSLFRHYPGGGTSLNDIGGMGNELKGIAVEPGKTHLWCYSANDTLYKFQKNIDYILSRKYLGHGFSDMTWQNDKLILARGAFIYLFDVSTFKVTSIYHLRHTDVIYGIAAVDSDLWVNTDGTELKRIHIN
jgi:hypothetical protein